jgi:hypothetical protein
VLASIKPRVRRAAVVELVTASFLKFVGQNACKDAAFTTEYQHPGQCSDIEFPKERFGISSCDYVVLFLRFGRRWVLDPEDRVPPCSCGCNRYTHDEPLTDKLDLIRKGDVLLLASPIRQLCL